MTKKKTNYRVTFSYRAVIEVFIKADSEDEARQNAIEEFENYRSWGPKSTIGDDNYKIQGILNETESWDKIYK